MTGYLAAQGVHASEERVGRALRSVHEPYHRIRQQVNMFHLYECITVIKCTLTQMIPYLLLFIRSSNSAFCQRQL